MVTFLGKVIIHIIVQRALTGVVHVHFSCRRDHSFLSVRNYLCVYGGVVMIVCLWRKKICFDHKN